MLIIARKIEESIMINDNIEIKVIGIAENVIKLGITAPKDIHIRRGEISKIEIKK